MIVLGNKELSLAMKFCGIRESHYITAKAQVLEITKNLPNNELIMANASIISMVPELREFSNLVSIPDDVDKFDDVDDLKYIVKSAIGVELEGI